MRKQVNSLVNALTFDVEEHFQVHNFEKVIHRKDWDEYPSRVVPNTRRILELLSQFDVRATFFVLGWVAERNPELVQDIADGGHEIATHGYWHELIYRQTADEFASDLERSLDAITRASSGSNQVEIKGYRAPGFSITQKSLWALDVLSDHGIRYDSSIFPLVVHDRYGIRDANRFATRVRQDLWEVPVSTLSLGNRNWPVAGGGYLRLFPPSFTRYAIRRINSEGHPAVIYLHPWEFDPAQPRVADASRVSRFRHYVNLSKTEGRLRDLLERFDFAPVNEVFAARFGES